MTLWIFYHNFENPEILNSDESRHDECGHLKFATLTLTEEQRVAYNNDLNEICHHFEIINELCMLQLLICKPEFVGRGVVRVGLW